MALTQPVYLLLRKARDAGLLPQNGAILEFGEANWYGDMPISDLLADLQTLAANNPRVSDLMASIAALDAAKSDGHRFAIAKVIYGALFSPSVLHAIDFHGTEIAWRLDLNEPLSLPHQYEVTMNNGTAEHILNIGQFFKSMHDWTKPGGLILHESPFTGWVDHGFYTLQPTLFFDLASANSYDLLGLFYLNSANHQIKQFYRREDVAAMARAGEITNNASLFVAMRKSGSESPFVTPFQGYYAGPISQEQKQAWKDLR